MTGLRSGADTVKTGLRTARTEVGTEYRSIRDQAVEQTKNAVATVRAAPGKARRGAVAASGAASERGNANLAKMDAKFGALEGFGAFQSQVQSLGASMANFASSGVQMATTLSTVGAAAAPSGAALSQTAQSALALAGQLGILDESGKALEPAMANQMGMAVKVGQAWSLLQSQVGLLAAQLLGAFGPELETVIGALRTFIGGIQSMVTALSTGPAWLRELVTFLALLVGGFMAVMAVVAPFIMMIVGIGAVVGTGIIGPIALGIAAVVALVAAFIMFKDEVGAVLGWIWKEFSAHFLGIGASAKHAGMSVMGAFTGLPAFFGGLIGKAVDGFKAGWEALPEWAQSAVAALAGLILLGPAGMFTDAGQKLMRAFADGIMDGIKWAADAAASAARAVGRFLIGRSPPPEGDLSVIDTGAAAVIQAWHDGAVSQTGLVADAGNRLAATFENSLALDGSALASLNVTGRGMPALAPAPAVAMAAPGAYGVPLGTATTATGISSLAAPQTTGGESGDEEAKPGMVGQMLGMVTEKFGGLVASFGPLGIVATLLEGVFEGLTPLIDSVKEPLRIVGTLLGAAMAPVLKMLFPIFKVVAIAATYIGQIFFTVASGIAKAIGSVIKALGTAIDKVPFLGDFGLKKLGQGMIDTGKGFSDSAKDLAKGREEIKKLEFGETAKSAEQANEAMRNVPEGFKIAMARFNVTTPTAVAGPTAVSVASPGIATASVPVYAADSSVAVQSNPVTIQQVHISSDDPEKIWHKLKDVMERNNLRRGGSPIGAEMAMMV